MKEYDSNYKTWEKLPKKHGWAFYYYLEKNNDNPVVLNRFPNSITIRVEKE